jgi:hypothetical protein
VESQLDRAIARRGPPLHQRSGTERSSLPPAPRYTPRRRIESPTSRQYHIIYFHIRSKATGILIRQYRSYQVSPINEPSRLIRCCLTSTHYHYTNSSFACMFYPAMWLPNDRLSVLSLFERLVKMLHMSSSSHRPTNQVISSIPKCLPDIEHKKSLHLRRCSSTICC